MNKIEHWTKLDNIDKIGQNGQHWKEWSKLDNERNQCRNWTKSKKNQCIGLRDTIGSRLKKVVLLICIKKSEQMHKYNLRGDCCNNRSRARRKKQKCIHQFCIFIWDFTPCIFKIFSSTQYSKASELLKHRFVSNLIIVTGTDLAVDGGYGAMGPEGSKIKLGLHLSFAHNNVIEDMRATLVEKDTVVTAKEC